MPIEDAFSHSLVNILFSLNNKKVNHDQELVQHYLQSNKRVNKQNASFI